MKDLDRRGGLQDHPGQRHPDAPARPRHATSTRAGAVRLGESANDARGAVRPAARRRPHPEPRADAGPALRHPAPGPPRGRGGQGGAGRARATPGARRRRPSPGRTASASGATFLRNNLNKRSVAIDLQSEPAGPNSSSTSCATRRRRRREPRPGQGRAGSGSTTTSLVAGPTPPGLPVDLRLRQRRHAPPTTGWPAYASVAEAMSGIYEYSRLPHQPPVAQPDGRPGRHRAPGCSP